LPAQDVSSYHGADVRLAWHATRQIELSVVGQNLLQPHHAEYGGNPGPNVRAKRNVFAAITWRQ
jgi:iron complex outermembrane receptor protein